jgi:hypothetical protein
MKKHCRHSSLEKTRDGLDGGVIASSGIGNIFERITVGQSDVKLLPSIKLLKNLNEVWIQTHVKDI